MGWTGSQSGAMVPSQEEVNREWTSILETDPDFHGLVPVTTQHSLLSDGPQGSLNKTCVAPGQGYGADEKDTDRLEPPIRKEKSKKTEDNDES